MFARLTKLTSEAVTTAMLERIEDVKKENAKLANEVTNVTAQLEREHEEKLKWKKDAEVRSERCQTMTKDMCVMRKEKKTMQTEMETKDLYIAGLEESIAGNGSDGPVESSEKEKVTCAEIAALLKSKLEYTEAVCFNCCAQLSAAEAKDFGRFLKTAEAEVKAINDFGKKQSITDFFHDLAQSIQDPELEERMAVTLQQIDTRCAVGRPPDDDPDHWAVERKDLSDWIADNKLATDSSDSSDDDSEPSMAAQGLPWCARC